MVEYEQPLSVFFVYHPYDAERKVSEEYKIKDCVEYCFEKLQSDSEKPFSRFINIPVFYKTSQDKNQIPEIIDSQSKSTIIFLLVSSYVIADKDWKKYFERICNQSENYCVIPVALDNYALKFETKKEYNFIRAYEFEMEYYKENFLLAVSHEIYRWVLNPNKDKCNLGIEKSVKVFLSHTKEKALGVSIAKQIKTFLDNTNIRRFFDATDIAPNYKFSEEIKENIADSTLLVIHTDPYASKYWCQQEILLAKKCNIPIIAVDCLTDFEDRSFPHATNISSVHINCKSVDDILPKKILYKIILSMLLETLRFYYSKSLLESYQNLELIPKDAIILSRPPEFCDLEKILQHKDNEYFCKNSVHEFYYPEPIVYYEELEFFENLGIHSKTLLNSSTVDLVDSKIGISISELNDEELINNGQYSKHLIQVSQNIARHLLAKNATLIYGGDLRQGGFTEFLFEEASALQSRQKTEIPHLKNYIAYPIYLKKDRSFEEWVAKYDNVAEMKKSEIPNAIQNETENIEDFFVPDTNLHKYIWSKSLTYMRETMIDDCDIRICAGGKHKNYSGLMPGILEEIKIAIQKNKPIYLLGGFGGVTSDICHIIKTGRIPEKLTQEWQIYNNSGYKNFLDYYQEKENIQLNIYKNLNKIFNEDAINNNGLTKEENFRLFTTPFIDEVIYLILKGIKTIN